MKCNYIFVTHTHRAYSYVHYINQRMHSTKYNKIEFENTINDKYRTSTCFSTTIPSTGVYYNKGKQVKQVTGLGVYSFVLV
jgi:hypothetical protein